MRLPTRKIKGDAPYSELAERTEELLKKEDTASAIRLNEEAENFEGLARIYEKINDKRTAIRYWELCNEFHRCASLALELGEERLAASYYAKERWFKNAEDIYDKREDILAVIQMYELDRCFLPAANYALQKFQNLPQTCSLESLGRSVFLLCSAAVNFERAGYFKECADIYEKLEDQEKSQFYQSLEALLN